MSGLLPPLSSRTSTMSHPTCCCSVSLDRCDRCDLLVGLEGFHLMSVARFPDALVLDIESCDRCAGCPGCGVIAQGHGRVVVEVLDAPWAGVPVRIRWFKRRWMCRETTCRIVTFIEQNHSVCAPRARLGVRAIRWAIRQLRFEEATILGLARQLGTTWNTVWSHVKPCLQAASDDPARFAGVRVLGVDERVWHHQDRRRRGPRELTGIVDHSREGSPHGPLIGPGPRQVWHRVQELARRARRRLPCGGANRRLDPFQGQHERHRLACSKMPPACWMPFTSSNSPATPQVRCAGASSKTRPDTAGAQAIPSTKSGFSCAPHATSSPRANKNDSVRPSRQMRHKISVEVAYHCAQQVRDVFHQATPAQGRHLAARLIESLPTCPIPEIARLGRTLRKWKDAFLAYFDTAGASNGPTQAINASHRTRQTHRQRLPQPHQLPTPNAPHRRRPRRLHPHPTMKSHTRCDEDHMSAFDKSCSLFGNINAQRRSSRVRPPGSGGE